jgi:hypothetical protein
MGIGFLLIAAGLHISPWRQILAFASEMRAAVNPWVLLSPQKKLKPAS